jgi:hypothetical protein
MMQTMNTNSGGGLAECSPSISGGGFRAAFPSRVGGFWERFTEGQNAPTLDGEVAKGNRPVCHDTNSGNVYKTL